MKRGLAKMGWVIVGLIALAVTGWAVSDRSSTRQPTASRTVGAVEACGDVTTVLDAIWSSAPNPDTAMVGLLARAHQVTDPGLRPLFLRLSQDYENGNAQAGLVDLFMIDRQCASLDVAR